MNSKRTEHQQRTHIRIIGTLTFFLTLTVTGILAQDGDRPAAGPGLDREEIRSPRVDFINRSNRPYSEALRRQEIASGSAMADAVIAENQGAQDGISVKRVMDPNAEGYGADIVTIGPSSNIGHVNRIQRVLIGYLMKAFQYSEADAEIVSRFILYYNANNRSNTKLLADKYAPIVAENVDGQKLGIDRSYRNWSGNTQMVIPLRLSAVRPGETDLNNKELDEETKDVEPAEKEEFKKVQEERSKDELEKLDDKSDELQKQQEALKKQQEELKRQQEEAETSRTDTGKRLEELRQDPNADPAEVKKAEEQVKKVEEQQKEVAKKIEETQQKQEQTQQKQAEVKKQQQEVAENQKAQEQQTAPDTKKEEVAVNTTGDTSAAKIDELQKENEELKKQQEQKEEVSENVVQDKILFMRVLRLTSKGHYNNELWYIDAAQDDALKRSSFTKICSRDFIVIKDVGILVTGYVGEVDDPSDHRLILLATDSLDKTAESTERVFWNTPMIYKDDMIYSIMEKDGEYYLARFKSDLSVEVVSSAPVNLYSDITFYKEKIYLTGKPRSGENTTIQVFNRSDLKLVKTIEPPAQSANR